MAASARWAGQAWYVDGAIGSTLQIGSTGCRDIVLLLRAICIVSLLT